MLFPCCISNQNKMHGILFLRESLGGFGSVFILAHTPFSLRKIMAQCPLIIRPE
jgi:hypothetical protein